MACYIDESDLWKCPKHPSKCRRTGICPTCLRDRLITLCPECANSRPCSCCTPRLDSTSSSSSSSSSSFSLFPFSTDPNRVSNLIENEPAFTKSQSLAIPLPRSRSKYEVENNYSIPIQRSKNNFWSVFKGSKKNKKCELRDDESNRSDVCGETEDYSMMMRSRSVAVGTSYRFGPTDAKRRGWYFPSPMKAFRQAKTSK